MSQALTLARPYARAAFALAQEGGRLPQWSQMIGFSAAASAVPQASAALHHPLAKAEALVDLLLPPGDSDPTYRRFLVELAGNRRLSLLPEITGQFDELRFEAERVVKAKVTSAVALPASELDTIKAALAKRFGREVEVEASVDESLIGGAVIDAGDVVIDGSLKGKLGRLQAALAH